MSKYNERSKHFSVIGVYSLYGKASLRRVHNKRKLAANGGALYIRVRVVTSWWKHECRVRLDWWKLFFRLIPIKFKIRVGSTYNNNGIEYNIRNIILHENYNTRTFDYDAALIMVRFFLCFRIFITIFEIKSRW